MIIPRWKGHGTSSHSTRILLPVGAIILVTFGALDGAESNKIEPRLKRV